MDELFNRENLIAVLVLVAVVMVAWNTRERRIIEPRLKWDGTNQAHQLTLGDLLGDFTIHYDPNWMEEDN